MDPKNFASNGRHKIAIMPYSEKAQIPATHTPDGTLSHWDSPVRDTDNSGEIRTQTTVQS